MPNKAANLYAIEENHKGYSDKSNIQISEHLTHSINSK